MKHKLKFAVIGCGFWARYQIAAWKELEGIELVALYNRTIEKASLLAQDFNVPRVYDDIHLLFEREELDFVDIITDVNTHAYFTLLAASHHIPVICQKPMAQTLLEAERMLKYCQQNKVPLYIHENFRWQGPIRKVKELIKSNVIGSVFKARVSYCSAFPVIANQPFLADLEEFILTDIGSHILDVCRFLLGEVDSLYCVTNRVNRSIKGEDVANISMKMRDGIFCFAEMSYASLYEKEVFPQTLLLIEGAKGSIRLDADYAIKVTTSSGTISLKEEPIFYKWVDPLYAVVHSSIVDCNRNILGALLRNLPAETTGEDNYETARLVWAAYESFRTNTVIQMKDFKEYNHSNILNSSASASASL